MNVTNGIFALSNGAAILAMGMIVVGAMARFTHDDQATRNFGQWLFFAGVILGALACFGVGAFSPGDKP